MWKLPSAEEGSPGVYSAFRMLEMRNEDQLVSTHVDIASNTTCAKGRKRWKHILDLLAELKVENTRAEGEIRLQSQHKARGFAGFLWTLLLAISNISAQAPSFRGS